MKTRHRNLDVVHSGMVLISDGKGRGRPARLQLTKDQLTIQVPVMSESESESASPAVQEVDQKPRTVTLQRAKGGLGLSIKGGQDGNQTVPIVISKLMIGLPAEQCGQLYVGDTILTINGVSVDLKTHDEVVQMLKDAGNEVVLTVKNNPQIAPYMKSGGSLKSRRSGSALDRMYETNTWKSALKQQVDTDRDAQQTQKDDDNEGWKTIAKIPLPMAFVTRYLWGTDKIRHNQFEVRAVDGKSTGIVHCEDKSALEQWIKHIQTHINAVNQKSIKMSNKYLHPSEQISYIGWVEERMPEGYFEDPKQRWEPRFVIYKGSDFCMFESPPLNSEDLEKCICLYKTFETALKVTSHDGIRRDRREHTCWIETAEHNTHYLSLGSSQLFKQFENAYNTCIYKSVTTIQTRTFACSYESRPCGLVLDIKQGISLYDIPTKKYAWQYRFQDLDSSSDDGKLRLQMIFKDERSISPNHLEIKDIECDQLIAVVLTLHAFYVTKIMGADPEYLRAIPLK